MVNPNLLKAEFIKNNMTQAEVAKAIGMSPRSLSRKLNKGVFGSDEIQKLIDLLDIKDPVAVFFADQVT